MPQDGAEELRDQFQDATDTIHASIRDGRLSHLQALLNAATPPPNLNHIHQKYGTPLHFAAWCGDLDAVELLLAAGANPLARAFSRGAVVGMPIDSAAKNGHEHIVKLLWSPAVQEIQSRKRDYDFTTLTWAAEGGSQRIVEHLLMWDGWTGNHKAVALVAAATYWHLDAVAAFLKNFNFPAATVQDALASTVDERARPESDTLTQEGWDYYNLERVIELLVDHLKRSTDKVYSVYSFMLTRAPFNANFTGVLKVMLDKGVNANRQGGGGQTALHTLASPRHLGIRRSDREVMNKPAIKLLLQHGASVATPDNEGVFPIHIAAHAADLDSFRIFLSSSTRQGEDEQALLSLPSPHKETLLHYAAAGHQVDNMQYLILQGLDTNAKSSHGWTPLLCALMPRSDIIYSHIKRKENAGAAAATKAALVLLSHGADPTVATHDGWTPLHVLALHCDLDIHGRIESLATELISRGLDPEARAPLIRPARNSIHEAVDIPWGRRLFDAMSSSSQRPVVVQPNLTPLLWAAQCGAVGVVRALLAARIDITVTDMNGMSASAMAWEIRAVPRLAEAANAIVNLLIQSRYEGYLGS